MADRNLDALGYGQITSLSAAVAVSSATFAGAAGFPAGTSEVVLQPETQNVRYRDDGTNPTASVGMILFAGTMYTFDINQIARMNVIETVASAKLNISCYGTKGPGL